MKPEILEEHYKDSRAAITLAKILKEKNDPRLMKKLSVYLNRYHKILKVITGLQTGRNYLMLLQYKDIIKQIEEDFTSVEQREIKTYFSNLITYIYRKKFHEIQKDLFYQKKYKDEWIKLRDSGYPYKEIAQQYNTTKNIVKKILTEAQ